jgi:hypothetical protein
VISIQSYILWALGIAALGTEIYALVDAARYRPEAYLAADKRTKPIWLGILAVATAVGFVVMGNVLSLPGIIAFVAAAVYLADVRPALRSITGRRGGGASFRPW